MIAIELPRGPLRGDIMTIHKSLGVTAFVLFFPRLIVRWIEKAPPYVPPLGALTHAASWFVHLALYALMILLPLTGYVPSEAGKHDFYWFWLFPIPNFVAPDEALDRATETGPLYSRAPCRRGAYRPHWRGVLARLGQEGFGADPHVAELAVRGALKVSRRLVDEPGRPW